MPLKVKPLPKIVDGEMVALEGWRKFLPAERGGYRGARPRSGGIRGNSGSAAGVAQVVDKDFSAAQLLGHDGHVPARAVRRHRVSDAFSEGFGVFPIDHRVDRKQHMQTLAARGLHEALQT